MDWAEEARRQRVLILHKASSAHRSARSQLAAATSIAESYEELICRIVLILGSTPPGTDTDRSIRDLVAESYDALSLAKTMMLASFVCPAFSLLRRAFELISLLRAFRFSPVLHAKWLLYEQVENNHTKQALQGVEEQEALGERYRLLCRWTHVNRKTVAFRRLGEANQFSLGLGTPPEERASTFAWLNLLDLWQWLAVALYEHYLDIIDAADPDFRDSYLLLHDRYSSLRASYAQRFGEEEGHSHAD